MKSLKFLTVAAAAMIAAACATVVSPTVGFLPSEPVYISPLNGDGIQDALSIAVDLEIDPRGVLAGYSITVFDENGAVTRLIQDEASTPGFFRRIRDALAPNQRESVPVPEVILWDGRDNYAEFVEDGIYTVILEAWDFLNNRVKADPITVIVDNTPPSIALSIPYRIFSPNDDGSKDNLPISQTATAEDLWVAKIIRVGANLIEEIAWEGMPPNEHVWAGKNSNGGALPDGFYRYEISSTDRAGNSGSASLDEIGINTQPTPVSVALSHMTISPNGDGIADALTISPFFPAADLDGWILEVVDTADNRIMRRQGVDPGSQIWDGTDGSAIVRDGRYFIEFSAVYINGNTPRVRVGPVMVDTTPPFTRLSTDYVVFSPEGDGLQDTFTVFHRDSTFEKEWTSEIRAGDGRTVYWRSWDRNRPGVFIWNGTDTNGSRLPDGTYEYRITAVDDGGNAFSAAISDVRIDTRPTFVTLNASTSAFSPNGDGVLETVTIRPDVAPTDGVGGWTFRVRDSGGRVVRQLRGLRVAPVVWSGLADTGTRAPDGVYSIEYEVIYEKGNRPIQTYGPLEIDTEPPRIRVSADYTLFSPDNDGRRDTIVLRLSEGSVESVWFGEVRNTADEVVKTVRWENTPPDFTWDGKNDSGVTLTDGEYAFNITSTDAAGNTGGADLSRIRIDTRRSPVLVRSQYRAFSPNNDGVKDRNVFQLDAAVQDGITKWILTITREQSTGPVKTYEGTTWVRTVDWDGRADNGTLTLDGAYTAELSVEYENGAISKSSLGPILIDTVFPSATLTADYTVFSPDGDGKKDTLTIAQRAASTETVWSGVFRNSAGTDVNVYRWEGQPVDIIWDGKSSAGRNATDGQYSYHLSATDEAGNAKSFSISEIRIDSRRTPIYIQLEDAGFSPNRDGRRDTITFLTKTDIQEGIIGWRLEAVNAQTNTRAVIRTGTQTAPSAILWDGTLVSGGTVSEGRYYAVFSARYEKGNEPSNRTADFVVDLTGPVIEMTVSPIPFSPDGDGADDAVFFALRARDPSTVESWQLRIFDPTDIVFTQFNGLGIPPRYPITWDGRGRTGELVQAAWNYKALFTAQDRFGNRSNIERPVPVDVYIIREGDRLRIQISSIYFAPFSPEFEPTKEEENQQVLRRLSEVLKKYPFYNIAIEGHAVRIYWNNETRGKIEESEVLGPLSEKRAETVKRALAALGIQENRMTTAGFGGTRPVVPHSDLENRWKNRRAEFILQRD